MLKHISHWLSEAPVLKKRAERDLQTTKEKIYEVTMELESLRCQLSALNEREARLARFIQLQ